MTTNGTLKSISWTYPCLSQTGVSPSLYFLGQHLLCAGGAWSGSYTLVLGFGVFEFHVGPGQVAKQGGNLSTFLALDNVIEVP